MATASSIRAGAAYVELFVKDNRLVKGLKSAQQKLAAFGTSIKAMGVKLLALGGGVAAPLLASLKVFGSYGDSLAKMSGRTGIAVETLSELGYAADQSGASLQTVEASVRKMQKTIVAASDGMGTAVDALARLGLSAQQLQSLSPDEQFRTIADRLAQIEDPTLRAVAALEIFGRSGTQLLPLMQNGAAGIRELEQQARDLGLTISGEDAAAAEIFGDRLDDLVKVLRSAAFTIGAALAPLVTELTKKVIAIATQVSAWIKHNKTLVLTIAKVAATVFAGGIALVAIGVAFQGLAATIGLVISIFTGVGAAIGAIGTALAALLSPIGLVIAGITALAAYLLTGTQIGQQALAWLGERFTELRDTALAAFQGISDALAAGDISLAAKILWLTLKMEWQKGINFLNKYWQEWKTFFLRVFNEAVFNLAGVFTDAWAGLQIAWVESVGFMADAWTIFTASLTKGWRTAQNFISKGVLRLIKLFDDSIDVEGASRILDEDMARANRQTNEQVNRTIVEREQNRLGRRREIEDQRQGAQSSIDDMRAEEERKLASAQSAALGESQRALDEARQEWRDAIDQAAKKREEAKAGEAPGSIERFQSQFDGLDEELAGTEKRTVGVKGTFSALAAAQGLGAGDAADRTATATESIDVNMRKLLTEVQRGGAAFE